jgi:hypothetical protein
MTKQREALEKEYEWAKSKNQEETKHWNELEHRVGEFFGNLPNTAQENELPTIEKIDQIVQEIARY